MPKAIVVFSDGTGNSSAALQRTNVWRLYDGLDRTEAADGKRSQIAYYDNGVGTSSFKPLAILGGVFGVGLARNLLDCYKFVCRNYEQGDELYVFGFSRGAFTIRLLAGLIAREGIVEYEDEAQIDRDAEDVYRAYRRGFGKDNRLAQFVRNRRDRRIAAERRKLQLPQVQEIQRERPNIRFVGVWDTVAAYGMPIAELTRGFDRWVWPLSMPNYRLSGKVERARHALALDDERDTFHPLLWDELAEPEIVKKHGLDANRLQQVWFTGVHSDVGGGYPDDSLSYVSLEWMLGEAVDAGLRFKQTAVDDIRHTSNAYGPMHDSRSGLGGYYRYQPRKISAQLDPPDPIARIVQDPALKDRGLLTSVNVHESVARRIAKGTDSYAPIVLPHAFAVVNADRKAGDVADGLRRLSLNNVARAQRQELVWNDVWKRRVNYFLAVAVSLGLASMPFFKATAACTGPQCLLSPLINGLSAVLPDFLSWWIDAFARSPGVFVVLAVLLGLLVKNAGRLQTRITDRMRKLWDEALREEQMTGGSPVDGVYRWRTGERYQQLLRRIKWTWAPHVLGFALRSLIFIAIGGVVVLAAGRVDLFVADRVLEHCGPGGARTVKEWDMAAEPFVTSNRCFATGLQVDEGRRYRISFGVTQQWMDKTIITDPVGFGSDRMPLYARPLALLRRSTAENWFRPVLKIERPSGISEVQALDVRATSSSDTIYYADFTAGSRGEIVLYVNDVWVPYVPGGDFFYKNNLGSADVCIERIFDEVNPPQPSKCAAAFSKITRVGQTTGTGQPPR